MSLKIDFDSKAFTNEIKVTMDQASDKSLDESSEYLLGKMDEAFELDGMRDNNPIYRWVRVSIAALFNRRTFPKTGSFEAKQRYIEGHTPLFDTGKLRRSYRVLERIRNKLLRKNLVGAGVEYIKTHEEGGTISKGGKTFVVPPRRNLFITDKESAEIEKIFEGNYNNA